MDGFISTFPQTSNDHHSLAPICRSSNQTCGIQTAAKIHIVCDDIDRVSHFRLSVPLIEGGMSYRTLIWVFGSVVFNRIIETGYWIIEILFLPAVIMIRWSPRFHL